MCVRIFLWRHSTYFQYDAVLEKTQVRRWLEYLCSICISVCFVSGCIWTIKCVYNYDMYVYLYVKKLFNLAMCNVFLKKSTTKPILLHFILTTSYIHTFIHCILTFTHFQIISIFSNLSLVLSVINALSKLTKLSIKLIRLV